MPGMLSTLRLLLPALIPSWRFFEVIEPSPRVQWALLSRPDQIAEQWHEFRPHPAKMSIWTMICRLFWNPGWNEGLYMVSLAERLTLNPTDHSVDEIFRLIQKELEGRSTGFLQFRLVFVRRDPSGDGGGLQQDLTYLSAPRPRESIA